MMKLTILIAVVLFAPVLALSQPKESTFKKEEVSLKEGVRKKDVGFKKTSNKEANNQKINAGCGKTYLYGFEITKSKANLAHFELSNLGTCAITATVETFHVEDEFGTHAKEDVSLQVKPGGHASLTLEIKQDEKDKRTWILIKIVCQPNTDAAKSACVFIPNLTVGEKVAVAPNETPQNQIDILNPPSVTPPGTATGGSAGSKCSTPADKFIESYTFYNSAPGDVEVKFTTVNECLCEKFIAVADVLKFDLKTEQPLGKSPLKKTQSKAVEVPAKNDQSGEKGERRGAVRLKQGQAVTIKLGCAGANNNQACKGRIKDVQLVLR